MLPFAILGPYHPPHMFPKSRFMQLFTVFRNSVPTLPLCCYLLYLGPITLPTYVPKVEVYVPICAVLGPCHPPHICSQSRGLCCYLRYLGSITLPTYDWGMRIFLLFGKFQDTLKLSKPRFRLLFTVLGPYQPPQICSQSRGWCFYLQYFVGGRASCFIDPSRS